jgi:hypothetical protein
MSLFIFPFNRASDINLNPLAAATLTFYRTGSTTLATVYADAGLTTPSANPLTADAGGLFEPIYLDPTIAYRVVLKNAAGTTLQDITRYSSFPLAPYLYASEYVVGDGVTDDTTAFQALIDLSQDAGKSIIMPKFIKHGAVTIPSNVHLLGAGGKTTVYAVAGDYDLYTRTGSDTRIENLYISALEKTGGYEFVTACGALNLERNIVENVVVFGSMGGITDTATTGYHTASIYDHVQFRAHRGPGVYLRYAYAFTQLVWVLVDYVAIPLSAFTGFDISGSSLPVGAGGLMLEECDVLGTAETYNHPTQHAYVISNQSAVWFKNCRADTVGGIGYDLSNLDKCIFDMGASLCADIGVKMTNVSNSFGRIHVYGRENNSLTYLPALMDGIKFVSGCYNLKLSGGIIRDCSGHGINKSANQAGTINISDYIITSNTLRGLKSVGNSAFLVHGCSLITNTAGNYDLAGTFDFIRVTMINAGTIADVGPGPITG